VDADATTVAQAGAATAWRSWWITPSPGRFTLRHNSRLHHIGLGRALAGTNILVLAHDLDIRIIDRDTGELLRDLVLDPTKDYQARPRT
jgi:hypothetical protein